LILIGSQVYYLCVAFSIKNEEKCNGEGLAQQEHVKGMYNVITSGYCMYHVILVSLQAIAIHKENITHLELDIHKLKERVR